MNAPEWADRLRSYRSHKVVRAARINGLGGLGADPVSVDLDGVGIVEVPTVVFSRTKPEIGGYVVVYEDGYISYSPAAAFESGYGLIDGVSEPA